MLHRLLPMSNTIQLTPPSPNYVLPTKTFLRTSKGARPQISLLCGLMRANVKVEYVHWQTHSGACIGDIHNASYMTLYRRTRQQQVDLIIVVTCSNVSISHQQSCQTSNRTDHIVSSTQSPSATSVGTPQLCPCNAACHVRPLRSPRSKCTALGRIEAPRARARRWAISCRAAQRRSSSR